MDFAQTTTTTINNFLPQLKVPQQGNPWIVGILSSMIAGGLLIAMLAVSKQVYAYFLSKKEMDILKRHLLLGRFSVSTTIVSEVLPFDIKETLRTYDGKDGKFVEQLLKDKQFEQENPYLCKALWEGSNEMENERYCKNNKIFRAEIFKEQLSSIYKLNMFQRMVSAIFHAMGGASVNISLFSYQSTTPPPAPERPTTKNEGTTP